MSASASLVELVTAQADRIAEIFDILRLIEGWCASQAATRATRRDLTALNQRLARMEQLELDDPEWEQNDVAFHVTLARVTGNPVAVRMIEILRESFSALYRLKAVVVHNAEEKELVIRHHRDIYDALRRREPEAARAAIVAHKDYVQTQLEANLRGSGL